MPLTQAARPARLATRKESAKRKSPSKNINTLDGDRQRPFREKGNHPSAHDHDQQNNYIQPEKDSLTREIWQPAKKFGMNEKICRPQCSQKGQEEQVPTFTAAH